MASMRRLALSSRRGSSERPRRTLRTFAPLILASIRTLRGRFLDDPVHDMSFLRTRLLQSKVRSLLRTKAICALTSKPGTSDAIRWLPFGRSSLSALRRISVGRFGLSSYLLSLNPQTPGIVQRFVELPRDPQAMKQHGEFSSHRHHCPLFGILGTTLCDLLCVAPLRSEAGANGP